MRRILVHPPALAALAVAAIVLVVSAAGTALGGPDALSIARKALKIAKRADKRSKMLGSGRATLASGQTIHGAWAIQGSGSGFTGITFPIPAPAPVDSAHVVVAGQDTISGDGCSGSASSPVAGRGFVCIYIAASSGTTGAAGYGARESSGNITGFDDGSPYGFLINVTGANFFADGTWAYTAP